MSWESKFCVEHEVEMTLVDIAGTPGNMVAYFECPVGKETQELTEREGRDTSHLPVIPIEEPEGLDPLPD